jgi:alpha-1,2-mannosyltransferase
MTTAGGDVAVGKASTISPKPRVGWVASIAFFGALPVVVLFLLFYEAIRVDGVAFDFRVFYVAAEAALRGDTLYPSIDDAALVAGRVYVYPPLTAIAFAPLTVFPMELAGLFVMVLLVAAVVATPLVLGVRDWRCIGLVLLWPPVISAIQTGSVTLFLGLAAALVWRLRDRPVPAGLALGTALAVKLLLWPLGLWLAATKRISAAALALGTATLLALGSWVVVAFDGLTGDPALLSRLSDIMDDRGYTLYSLALEYGVPSEGGRVAWVALAVALLAAIVVVGRRGSERAAFVLAVAASLAVTPIVWLHYLSLLVVVVAVARPRLGLVWFVPLALVVTPGSGNPTPFQTTATVCIAATTILIAYREAQSRAGRESAGAAIPTHTPAHAQ